MRDDRTVSANVPEFTLERASVGLRNRDRFNNASLGEVEVKSGAWRFTAYVADDGSVNLPNSLADQDLARRISAAVRLAIMDEITNRWRAKTRYEERRP